MTPYAGCEPRDINKRPYHPPKLRPRILAGLSLEEAITQGQRKGLTMREIHMNSDHSFSDIQKWLRVWAGRQVRKDRA